MLARVEQRPRRPRKTHAPHVEVFEPRAALVEDVLEPRQKALARARVAHAYEALDRVLRQPVNLYDDDALRLRRVRGELEEQQEERERGRLAKSREAPRESTCYTSDMSHPIHEVSNVHCPKVAMMTFASPGAMWRSSRRALRR